SGASGIHEENSVARRYRRLVGMAADDDLIAACTWVAPHLVNVVNDKHPGVAGLHQLGFRKTVGPLSDVVIAFDSQDWSDVLQGVNDLPLAAVAGVTDDVH